MKNLFNHTQYTDKISSIFVGSTVRPESMESRHQRHALFMAKSHPPCGSESSGNPQCPTVGRFHVVGRLLAPHIQIPKCVNMLSYMVSRTLQM